MDKDVEDKIASGILIIGSFALALFFLSSNITGYTIADINVSDSNWIAFALIIFGIFGFYIYVRRKTKKF